MIEQLIKQGTCRISCGEEKGTGWLIDKDKIITARHCVLESIESSKLIEICFPEIGDEKLSGEIITESEECDACIISIREVSSIEPLPICLTKPCEGTTWETFGFPRGKFTIGHRLSGEVAQTLTKPKLKVDIDLSISQTEALNSYKGLSGAAVVSEGVAIAILRLGLDGSVAAISLNSLEAILLESGVEMPIDNNSESIEPLLADRGEFSVDFTKIILEQAGKYLFLEGAHGYGKTTFCRFYQPTEKNLVYLGSYRLSNPDSALGVGYWAQPETFFDWLITIIATLISGKAPRLKDKNKSELILESVEYIKQLSNYCKERGQNALLVVDGFNEISSKSLLDEFIGILPMSLPFNISIVLTSPNYSVISGHLEGRVEKENVLKLPPLSINACSKYCEKTLDPDRVSYNLIECICEKANGHPLYLRYLIEYANHQKTDDDLKDFPILDGAIEEYYDKIWAKLLDDYIAVSLISIMARLRWGIPLEDFAKILTVSEQPHYVSVLSRIRHLLDKVDYTTIYHSSFEVYIINQTLEIEDVTNQRISEYCLAEREIPYCILNRVFHLAKTNNTALFSECNQEWFDAVVELGVEPDALISDVDVVVNRSAREASPQEFFRLTLLAQRIDFRYNILFAQSARLIAEALIVLKRPEEALRHILRLDSLIIHPEDALEVAYLFVKHNQLDASLTLLSKVEKYVLNSYGRPLDLMSFVDLCSLHLKTHFQIRLAINGGGMELFQRIINLAHEYLSSNLGESESDTIGECLQLIQSESPVYFLAFRDEYAELSRLREQIGEEVDLSHLLRPLCIALLKFEYTVDNYGLVKSRNALKRLFVDLEELILTGEIDTKLSQKVTSTLIRFGASSNLVKKFGAKLNCRNPNRINLRAENGVDVNHTDLNECLSIWRIFGFVEPSNNTREFIKEVEWYESLNNLIESLYYWDGKSRRVKADTDEELLEKCFLEIELQVIKPLKFTLEERAGWKNAYAIPEEILPKVYQQLAELLNDCFPQKLLGWLNSLVISGGGQYGIYSEGYRNSTYNILKELTREKTEDSLSQKLFSLLNQWRDHVIEGVENRHELVPELLRMIPLYAYFDANEITEQLYTLILSVSMGPTWYKEDQLGIMTTVLSKLDSELEVSSKLPEVAGYLERASGEMTFQRYVRYQKSILLGEIARRGKYRAAFEYFKQQSCGSLEELWSEAEQGSIDKVGQLKGNRFPGGALDEQEAILEIVKKSANVSWQLQWALLEIFHCGDSRYIKGYAKHFARLCSLSDNKNEVLERLKIVVYSETSNLNREEFISVFCSSLHPSLHSIFSPLFSELKTKPNKLDPSSHINSSKKDEDQSDEDLHAPGVFGNRSALDEGDKLLEEAEKQLSIGNKNKAKSKAVEVLQTAQKGDWGIWGNLSKSANRAEDILVYEEKTAGDIIKQYASLLEGERHANKWIPAHHLINKVGSILNKEEGGQLMKQVVEHVRLIVGDSTSEIAKFDYLADDVIQVPDSEFFNFLIWLMDHPKWLRRDRSAAMVLWLIESKPKLLPLAIAKAFSMDEGQGPDVICGILDGISVNDPLLVWCVIEKIGVSEIIRDLHHVSRIVIFIRIVTRAADANSDSANLELTKLDNIFSEEKRIKSDYNIPSWTSPLKQECSQLKSILDSEIVQSWKEAMTKLCFPLSIEDAQALENAVLKSFREGRHPYDRWKAKLHFSLNLSLWSKVNITEAKKIELVLRKYNPSLPERNLIGKANPLTDQLRRAIKINDFSNIFGPDENMILHYIDMAVREDDGGLDHIEVLCLLQPNVGQPGILGPKPKQKFKSNELAHFTSLTTPFETCSYLEPKLTFLGSLTPSIPLPNFKDVVGITDNDYIRENWRFGRRNSSPGFGLAENSGCSLSVSKNKINIPVNLKLVWLVWINQKLVSGIDNYNNKLI